MKCPVCQIPLVMTERSGVEIDYCLQCRGVWLDRGELDKIVERSAQTMAPPANYSDKNQNFDKYNKPDERRYYGKKKKSFLDDIFDF